MAAGQPCRQTQHVAVHRRDGLAEGDGGDGARRVVAHPRQGGQTLVCIREHAAVPGHDDLRGLLQIPGAAVVPQPLPQRHELLLRRVGQRRHRGQRRHEAVKIRQHRRDAGLL